jgi:hypothetical protein
VVVGGTKSGVFRYAKIPFIKWFLWWYLIKKLIKVNLSIPARYRDHSVNILWPFVLHSIPSTGQCPWPFTVGRTPNGEHFHHKTSFFIIWNPLSNSKSVEIEIKLFFGNFRKYFFDLFQWKHVPVKKFYYFFNTNLEGLFNYRNGM